MVNESEDRVIKQGIYVEDTWIAVVNESEERVIKQGIYVENTWIKGNLELVGLTSMTTDSQSGHSTLETQCVLQVPAWVTKGEAKASEVHGGQPLLASLS